MSDQSRALLGGVSAIADRSIDQVKPEMRLVEDLGFDSLAIAELLAMLFSEFGVERDRKLVEADWRGRTVQDVLELAGLQGIG